MSAFSNSIADYDALGLANLVKQKEVKPVEIIETVIKRIEKINPELNFMAYKTYEQALEKARGPIPDGIFAGVPFLLKDLLLSYAGVPTSWGSDFYKNEIPQADSYIVQRLKAEGMILLGKSTCPEFGMSASTESRLFGLTRNPWNREYSTGGSSGGAAAAVAARILPMADANDGGGSTRMPASKCGVIGLKPSRGRVSLAPHYADFLFGLACVSCVSLTVRDTAAYLDVISDPVCGDVYFLPKPESSFLSQTKIKPGCLKIGYTTEDPLGGNVDVECIEAVEKTVKLCSELGHEMIETRFSQNFGEVSMAAGLLSWFATAQEVKLTEALSGRQATENDFQESTWQALQMVKDYTALQMVDYYNQLRRYGRELSAECQAFDVVLTPTIPNPPYKLGVLDPSLDIMEFFGRFGNICGFVQPFNVSGQPAISLPLHWSKNGLPIGIQFVGNFAREDLLIRLATQIEEAQPWIEKTPTICA